MGSTRALIVSGLCLTFAATAHAGLAPPAGPPLDMSLWVNGELAWDATPSPVQDNEDGTFLWADSVSNAGNDWNFDYNITGDPDPFIQSNIALVNNMGVTQTFTIIVDLPIAPALIPSSLLGGSVGGSTTDANFDGVGGMSVPVGSALYSGRLDGINQVATQLHSNPFDVPVGGIFNFAGETQNIAATSFGLPGPSQPGPAVLNSIGIQLHFDLAPGDSIALTSFFIAEIPAPGAGVLFAMAGLAATRRRR